MMTKKEFQDKFKDLVDGIVDELPLPQVLNRVGKKFARAPETVQKWYDGASAPVGASRDAVIKHLYAEQKKRELMDLVRYVIKNELTIEIEQDYHTPCYEGDAVSIEVRLKLDEEVIHTAWATLGW